MAYSRFLMRHLCVYYALMASFYNASIGALAKLISVEMSSFEIVFWRNFFGLWLTLYALKKARAFGDLKAGEHFWLLAFRGAIGVCGMTAFFYNIANSELGTAFTLYKIAPIFTALMAGYFFGEKLSFVGWVAVLASFVGVMLVLQPSLGIRTSDIVGVVGAMCSAMAMTSVRALRKYYTANTIVLSYMIAGALLTGVILLLGEFGWGIGGAHFVSPSLKGWCLLVLIAFGGYYFQLYLTKAFAATRNSGVPASIGYSEIIFSIVLGLILGDTLPNTSALFGIAIIIIAGIVIARQR
ncbi:MAG: DMT family transporter [Campylobacter sp.]|nr:DMT family transporter [Campylobacter sp.]